MSHVYGDSIVISKTPTLCSSATAYAAEDEIGVIQTLACGHGAEQGGRPKAGVILQNLSVVDDAAEATGMDVYFYTYPVTGAGDNAGMAVSGTQAQAYYAGHVRVSSTSYQTAGSVMVFSTENIGIYLQPYASGTVYALPVAVSATTYTSQALTFKYGFFRDL
jgi:hypothetical protein